MDEGTGESGLHPLDREEAWHTLVFRMMRPWPTRVATPQRKLEIFPCQIPVNLPIDLPRPPGSRIVGTVLNAEAIERISLYLDTAESPAELLSFYRARLQTEGWYELQAGSPAAHGFNDADESSHVRTHFCRAPQGPALVLTAIQQENGLTDLRLDLYTDTRTSLCMPQPGPPPNPVPPLPPPAGAQFVMGAGPTGSRGHDSAHSGVVIETELDLAAVMSHYTRHLEAGGWTKQESGQSDQSAWSTWTFRHERGEAWRGLLVVFQRPDVPNRYILETWAEWLGEAGEDL